MYTSKDEFGDRMKSYEAEYEMFLPKEKCIVIRLDGKGFSKLSKPYKKPFDLYLSSAMMNAAQAVMNEFKGCFVYTQSDEISIVIPDRIGKDGEPADHIFLGRSNKITTLSSSLASVTFNTVLKPAMTPMFDCRIMSLDRHEATNAIFWRMLDARKNAVSCTYRHTLGHAMMQNKNRLQMIQELGEVWDRIPNGFKHGVYTKPGRVDEFQAFKHDDEIWHSHEVRYEMIFGDIENE